MNTSMTAPQPRGIGPSDEGRDLACPSWCVYTAEEHARDADLYDSPLHKGPAIGGLFRVWQTDGEAPTVDIDTNRSDDYDAAGLRQLAAAAIAAAQWLEHATGAVPGAPTFVGQGDTPSAAS